MQNLQSPYKRILLKLSGEILKGKSSYGIEQEACEKLAADLHKIHLAGFELGVVMGGGNIFRGIDLKQTGMPRTPADQMGMLATFLNGIALQQALTSLNVSCALMSALECPKIAEPYNWTKALSYLEEKKVVIFVGGTGNPYFTTDTAAALRASEVQADVFIKATKVDGIYDRDPFKFKEAVKYSHLSYSQILAEKLQVIDATAVTLCQTNQIPIYVFHMQRLTDQLLDELLLQKQEGTWVDGQ